MPRGPRRGRWPALPVLLLCAGCATHVPQGDQWGVRRIAGRAPAVVSLSEVNPGQPAATRPLQPVVLRTVTRGADAVTVRIDDAFAAAWRASADKVEPELQRALDWLERIDALDARGLQLDVTLVDRDVHRREQRRHPASDVVRIDLLVPTAREPASRSASVAAALAIALHETVHALRGGDMDRAADEYRASLVESCYLLDVARAGDVIDLGEDGAGPGEREAADFTTRHSRDAAALVLAELRRAAGTARIGPADSAALRRARAYCHQRLRMPQRARRAIAPSPAVVDRPAGTRHAPASAGTQSRRDGLPGDEPLPAFQRPPATLAGVHGCLRAPIPPGALTRPWACPHPPG